MKTFEFTIIATGMDPHASDFEDRLFEAGCDDATIAFQKGTIVLEFDRVAKNFSHAIDSAIRDVRRAGAYVRHVEPDHLVNLSDIAARAGITKAAVSFYAKGERSEGFPAPVARVTTESPLWDWVEVAEWFRKQGRLSADVLVEARILRQTNFSILKKREPQRAREKRKVTA
jgi:hypothetical protein